MDSIAVYYIGNIAIVSILGNDHLT
jgi:hypothetical protein